MCFGDSAFYRCNSIETVVIPKSVKTLEYRAFFACSKLKNVTMSDGLTLIGGSAFEK